MNKNELTETLAGKLAVPRSESERIINTLLDIITESLKKDEPVTITGFGQFSVSHRAPRMGVNPLRPTERIQIPAVKTPKFTAGKTLKEAIKHHMQA
jgi:DNA-binding protein HU-beta